MNLIGGYTGRSPMIDVALRGFLEEGLSIHLGTCNARLEPSGGRAAAVKVDADGRHIVVYVPEVAIARLLPDLEEHGQAAINFGRPEDDRACQVKGVVVGIRPATDDEDAIVAAQWDGFMRQLETIGISRAVAAGWARWPARAVRVRVTAVFEQTPKPGTGYAIA